MRSTRSAFRLPALLVLSLLVAVRAEAGSVDPALASAIAGMKPGQSVPVIVQLSDRVNLAPFALGGTGHRSTAAQLVSALKAKAEGTQGVVLSGLSAAGGRSPISLWLINGIALTVPHEIVPLVAAIPGVEAVRLDAVLAAPHRAAAGASTTSAPPEWNLAMLGAPTLWGSGLTGAGAVVATLDTGVDVHHPDLSASFRGGTNSWYDPYGQHATPYDASGHGTQTMGLIVGGSAGGTAIGMAPGARWIAAKIFNDSGQGTVSAIHQAFQWVLDPDGSGTTADAPDVVNGSWGYPSTVGSCWTEFAADIAALRAAGISVVFSAGNDGGSAGTSESPANNPGALAVGAVDQTQTVAPFSSRGPSACGGGTFPAVIAPGVSVKTSDLTFGGIIPNAYATVTGTSFAAPQVTGAIALLWGAHRSASLLSVESALKSTAVDLGVTGPDGDYGNGLPDVVAANAALSGLPPPPTAVADAYAATGGTTLTVAAPGVLANDTGAAGTTLSAVLLSAPSAGTLSLASDGSFTYLGPTAGGTFTFTYKASDGAQSSAPATVTLTVAATVQPPVAAADAYAASGGTTLAVAAPGVLANDTSPSGAPLTAVLVSAPASGTLNLAANGSFTYLGPTSGGTFTFTYKASDGTQSSAPATVTLNVAAAALPPVAQGDSYAATAGATLAPAAPGVLGNDSSPSGAPLTAVLVSGPTKAKAGSFVLNANGSFTYATAVLTASTDSFTYRASDGALTSAVATVSIAITAHPAPVASADSFSVAKNSAGTALAVLSNDTATNATLVASSVAITSGPSHGRATTSSSGTVTYTPSRNFTGTDSFSYKVKDSLGATSNAAKVTVSVR